MGALIQLKKVRGIFSTINSSENLFVANYSGVSLRH